MLGKKQKYQATIQIGVWKQGDIWEAVWFLPNQEQNRPNFIRTEEFLTAWFIEHLTTKKRPLRFNYVVSLLPNHIWCKTLILPQVLNTQECEQQVTATIEKELPLPLEQLWFDYRSEMLKQGMKLEISVVIQETAKSWLEQYAPLSVSVLDNTAHAVFRAFRYLKPELPNNTLYLYHDEHFCLALQETVQEFYVLQQQCMSSALLFQRFKERYQTDIEQICIYHRTDIERHREDNSAESAVKNHQILTSAVYLSAELPFIALGNALWRTDLHQHATPNG
ncbi:hypothetical protein CBG46_01815 [Actinobacillus succinogenes]|uniref:Competence protein A n=1 Tax=Actinobacillus succinogenes (strain ATCC 55618 / DSM 22257 / CCUG 43843 / 130Z) TaxID=339671 RepID=A6VM68_ACTSZ|nr:pilus assembly protein PilM [Actinobacillus succinogenes]ABR74065.1 competence protein A [Actinobacillus succinogenes 130Z]PHI39501.1 hypothetical protein CBG46_01815 [Actinobacillus succinogenes]